MTPNYSQKIFANGLCMTVYEQEKVIDVLLNEHVFEIPKDEWEVFRSIISNFMTLEEEKKFVTQHDDQLTNIEKFGFDVNTDHDVRGLS